MFPQGTTAKKSLSRFPHVGGDVSLADAIYGDDIKFSPRRWGCFSGTSRPDRRISGFPHVGGDVSSGGTAVTALTQVFPT